MTRYHLLDPAVFDELAGGGGGAAAVRALRSGQLSKHVLLIGYLLERWPGTSGERDALAGALDQARLRRPDLVGDVLGAPLVGAWIGIAVQAELAGRASRTDFGHLSAVAMVACAAASVEATADVPVRDGLVAVPGLGVGVVSAVETAQLVARDGRLTLHAGNAAVEVSADPASEGPAWQPVRYLVGAAGGQRISVGLDDLDPYRHGHHAPPASRLPGAEVQRWQNLFADAWLLLAGHLPGRAAELAAGLRTLVPLIQTDERSARSATIRHAFGVFGLTRPPSAAEFAVTLVHEFQHSKLSAMLDLTPLTDPADDRRYFAPWRVDPRPLAGLLQGVYAFVGVADTWRALREVDGLAPSAEAHFAEARLQVDRGLVAIERSGALTDAGEAMAVRLRGVTDAMLNEPVAARAARAAEQRLERTWRQWRDRNGSAN
jgi:HEXXH motif-containing protein